jgi:NADH-quinone oxidoreductase subunit L
MWIAIAGAFVTAFYMARAVALTFHGTYKGHGHPHESPAVMTVPLIALAVPSVIAGLLNIPGVSWPGIGNFTEWLAVRVVPMGDHHAEAIDFFLAGAGLGAAVLGIAWAGCCSLPTGTASGSGIASRSRSSIRSCAASTTSTISPMGITGFTKGPLARFVDWTNTYVIDGIVNGVGWPHHHLGRFVYGGVDQRGVDGIINGLSAVADAAGSGLRKLQTGRVQQYAASFVVGVLVFVIVFVVVR